MEINFSKNEKIFLFLIMLFAAVFFFYSINDSVDTGDANFYLIGAKALAQGKDIQIFHCQYLHQYNIFPLDTPYFCQ